MLGIQIRPESTCEHREGLGKEQKRGLQASEPGGLGDKQLLVERLHSALTSPQAHSLMAQKR